MYSQNPIVLNGKPLPAASRLIVLIPDAQRVDLYSIANRIRCLAAPGGTPVLYVTLVKNYDDEMPAVHTMARLSAITHSARVRADTLVEINISWPALVNRLRNPGDLVLTFADHTVRAWGLWQKSISQVLAEKVNLPIYIIEA
jgi:hypothetical protein